MGLFDRLFGKIEEPKIEDVVKEALENIDLSDDSEQTETLESENIEVKEPQVFRALSKLWFLVFFCGGG